MSLPSVCMKGREYPKDILCGEVQCTSKPLSLSNLTKIWDFFISYLSKSSILVQSWSSVNLFEEFMKSYISRLPTEHFSTARMTFFPGMLQKRQPNARVFAKKKAVLLCLRMLNLFTFG